MVLVTRLKPADLSLGRRPTQITEVLQIVDIAVTDAAACSFYLPYTLRDGALSAETTLESPLACAFLWLTRRVRI